MGAPKDGRDLELAVWLIESLILRDHGLTGGKITVEPRKKIATDGILDEIDLYVRIEQAPGYESVFIFECKDRGKPSGKPDVDILRAKMERLNASAGYLVARAFTKGARAVAAKYPAMKLLRASEVPTAPILEGSEGAYLVLTDHVARTWYTGCAGSEGDKHQEVLFRGKPTTLYEVVRWMADLAASDRLASEEWPMEPYFGQTFLLCAGDLTIKGNQIAALTIEATMHWMEAKPSRIVGFEVEGRGKVLQVFFQAPNGRELMFYLSDLTAGPKQQPRA